MSWVGWFQPIFLFLAFISIFPWIVILKSYFDRQGYASVLLTIAIYVIVAYVLQIAFHILGWGHIFYVPVIWITGILGWWFIRKQKVSICLSVDGFFQSLPSNALPPLFITVFVLSRVMVLPPLGWDFLTYHGVKAALWAKGHKIFFHYDAPGAWEYYKTFLGGAEVYFAWAMLATHSELLIGVMDWIHWVLLTLILYQISLKIDTRKDLSIILTIFIVTAETPLKYVGAGYTDIPGIGFLLAGVLFYIIKKGRTFSPFTFYR